MKILYRKVAVRERKPSESKEYITDQGIINFYTDNMFFYNSYGSSKFPKWWLEEIPDNSHQIEKLEVDNAELLEALENILDGKKDGRTYISMDEIESLIQKHKQ